LSRRKWTGSEEDRFIDIWVHNLHLFVPGKKLTNVYTELELYYRDVGIEITAQGVKSKMETLKRKYFTMLHSDDDSNTWKHFDTMAQIVNSTIKDSKDTEWKDYTKPPKEPPKTSRKKSLVPTIKFQLIRFNSVFVDESSPHLFNDEEKPKVKRRRRRIKDNNNYNTSKTGGKRRVWQTAEESKFVDVWRKYGRDLQSDRKKMDVYKDMHWDLDELGISISPNDIKSKIESLTRVFRAHQYSDGDKSEWIHYKKVSQTLSPTESTFEPFDEPAVQTCSSSEEDSEWFKEMELKPEIATCGKPSSSNDSVVNESDGSIQEEPKNFSNPSNFNDSVVNQCDGNIDYDSHDSDSSIEFSMVDPDPRLCQVSIEILDQEEASKPIKMLDEELLEHEEPIKTFQSPPSEKLKAAEEFSKFVTKELAVLNDDLLIEAKRQIYNVICALQMKQNKVNKKS
ncbi:hypothetical protein KR084_008011, partial [Drosophila pseudotakahashii]